MADYKEQQIVLNTQDSGEAQILTGNIDGFLECFLIESNSYVNISIIAKGIHTFELLKLVNFSGFQYIPLRIYALYWNINRLESIVPSTERIFLNEPLLIEIKGAKNAEVKICIRSY